MYHRVQPSKHKANAFGSRGDENKYQAIYTTPRQYIRLFATHMCIERIFYMRVEQMALTIQALLAVYISYNGSTNKNV